MAVLRLRDLHHARPAVRLLDHPLASEGADRPAALRRHPARHARHSRPPSRHQRLCRRRLLDRRHVDVLGRASARRAGHRPRRLSACEALARCDRGTAGGSARLGTISGLMSTTFAGNYPIEHRKGEIARLDAQARSFAPDARRMLERIGVQPGWTCLDLGCGPRGITDLMSERVGPSGRVVGVDKDEGFVAHASAHAPGNVEFRLGDAYDSRLPSASFDLVHMRFIASTAGNPDGLLREALRLARPGGVVALQEPDVDTFSCYPPHPAWDRLMTAMLGVFAA